MAKRRRRPVSGIVGWATGWAVFERVEDDERYEIFVELLRKSGVATAPGLRYFAQLVRFYVDGGEMPSPPGFKAWEIEFINRRARESLAPYVGHPAFTRMRPLGRAA